MDNRDIDIMNVYWDYFNELRDLQTSESRMNGCREEGVLIDAILSAVLTIFKVKETRK